ncbi:MAG: response regulator transcription factor [Mariprofundaceae bacterium]|nr:response regulator transcription factor [Mariprofundaceae bacterium]
MSETPSYSVLLLEDEKPTRQHLVGLIERTPHLNLFAEASTCAEAKAALELGKPSILIADINLPDGCGIDVIRYAITKYPDLEAMVLTICGDEENVVHALEAGATGYLLKEQALEGIGDAVFSLMRGETAISPKIARFLLKRFKKKPAKAKLNTHHQPTNKVDNSFSLTPREHEVLEMIAKGFRYNEIADALGISTNTIRAHIRNIYRKMSVKSRSEAVFEAAKMGIISLN